MKSSSGKIKLTVYNREGDCLHLAREEKPSEPITKITREVGGDFFHYARELNGLPFEVLDAILINSFLHWILKSSPDQTDGNVIKTLASVDFCWFQRVTSRRFKKRIWGQIKDFFGKSKKRSSIIRNNRNYLLENVQPNDEFFESLLSLNCTTEEQSHFIQRQRSNRDKNAELLKIVRSFNETKFSNFVRCLRQTNQRIVARVMENGGVVIKVEMWNSEETSMETQYFHQRIEDLGDKTKPWSHDTNILIGRLRENGIQILNSQLDRQTVVVWIWCHSQVAIQYMQILYESNQLKDVLFALTNSGPSESQLVQSKVININSTEFKKTTVVCPISIIATHRFDVGRAFGLTKLRNKIYVLGETRSAAHVIRVFEDQNPFRLEEKIEVKGSIEKENGCYGSGDIVASESQNCLYVSGEKRKAYKTYYTATIYRDSRTILDSEFNYIWRITIETGEQNKAIKWLTIDYEPSSLSVTNDSHLLVVSCSSSILMIYGSNAELIRSIQLPRDFKDVRHAVETSSGNFIITHNMVEEEDEVETGSNWRMRETKQVISEVTSDGQMVIRRFIGSNKTRQLRYPEYLSLDSDDRVYVADDDRVILMDSDLKWNRILLSTEGEEKRIRLLHRMFYDKEKKQLILAGFVSDGVNVYTLG